MTQQKLAIVNGVKTDRKGIVAVCEWATYDVWGNAKDGYEVNDVYRQERTIEIPVTVEIHNMPRIPGASDAYRSFPDSMSIACEVLVCFNLSDASIRKALGITCKIETDGDDRHITINREKDGYPLAELDIVRYEEIESV